MSGLQLIRLVAADGEACSRLIAKHVLAEALPNRAADSLSCAIPGAVIQMGHLIMSCRSVCSDEVNFLEKELVDLMKQRWGESFSLGGLAGVPFAGKAGLAAYAHHVPDEGKLFVMFAPHVGVDSFNKVGKLERVGQTKSSTACGAAVGAFKALTKPGATVPAGFSDVDDLQITYIISQLAPKLGGLKDAFADGA